MIESGITMKSSEKAVQTTALSLRLRGIALISAEKGVPMNVNFTVCPPELSTEVEIAVSSYPKMGEETLAATAISWLPKSCTMPEPGYLVDCRTSSLGNVPAPSYKLGVSSSLFRSLTFSFEACGGLEALYSLMVLDTLMAENETAIVSCLQGVGGGGNIDGMPGYKAFPMAAALAVAGPKLGSGIPLLGMSLGQASGAASSLFCSLLDKVLDCSCMALSDLHWSVAPTFDKPSRQAVRNMLPNVVELRRDIHVEQNLGCTDPFVTLACALRHGRECLNGPGIIFFAGTHGESGALLLSVG